MKTGKDPDFPKEVFPGLDLNGPPIVINAVDTSALSPTEEAYYFASTSVRNVFAEKDEGNEQVARETSEEAKNKRIQKVKETKKRKRKAPEAAEKAEEKGDASEGGEVQDEEKTEKNDACMACGGLYKAGDTMIQCDGNCIGWYHMECAHLAMKDVEKYADLEWKCEYCLKGVDPPYAKKNVSNEPAKKKKKVIGK